MTLSANAVLGAIIVIAIIAAYVVMRRMNERRHNAKMAAIARRIEAAEQRDRKNT